MLIRYSWYTSKNKFHEKTWYITFETSIKHCSGVSQGPMSLTEPLLVQVMASCLLVAMPLPVPMMTYLLSILPIEQNLNQNIYKHFLSRKCIWKFIQYSDHFILASVCNINLQFNVSFRRRSRRASRECFWVEFLSSSVVRARINSWGFSYWSWLIDKFLMIRF